MYKSCAVLLLAIVLQACASNADNHQMTSIPKWVSQPPQDNAKFIYGIGEGFSLEKAKQSGLKDIASKFAVNVSSSSENKTSVHNGKNDHLFQQEINTQIENIKLSSYELLKTEQHQNQYYVLLAMSRADFIKEKKAELELIKKNIALELESANSKIDKLYRYNKILPQIAQAEPLLGLLSAASSKFDSKAYWTLFKQYKQDEKQLRESTQFTLKAGPKLDPVAKAINNALQVHGLQVGSKQGADAVIEIQGDVLESEVFSTKNVQIDFSLLVKSSTGVTLSKEEYKLAGSSVSNYAAAKKNAVNSLLKKVKDRAELYAMLGLKAEDN